jgi:2-polyprenyl-6-methoxyphenol hydroxylase-like FAD-dependent oxidoreductase
VRDLFSRAGGVELAGLARYENKQRVDLYDWTRDSVGGLPAVAFSHQRLQETAFLWACEMGAVGLRPAKGTTFSSMVKPSLTITRDDGEETYTARLIVGADGKRSMARRWTGGDSEADPEHHRMGGVQVCGIASDDRATDNVSIDGTYAVNWFAQSAETSRLYLLMRGDRLRQSGVDRSFAALVSLAARYLPEGALEAVRQDGPIAFFPNNDTWATRTAGNNVVLIGDAAGSPDPSVGHGTSLIFRDIRELSELLLSTRDWSAATAEYATRRETYFDVIRAVDRWQSVLDFGEGPEADRLREGNMRAKERDPTLGGLELMVVRGPDGLAATVEARRQFFGEDV